MARVGGMFGSYSGSSGKSGSGKPSKAKGGFTPKPSGYGKRRKKKKGR